MNPIEVYQIVQAMSRRRHFMLWVVTLAVGLNVEMVFN